MSGAAGDRVDHQPERREPDAEQGPRPSRGAAGGAADDARDDDVTFELDGGEPDERAPAPVANERAGPTAGAVAGRRGPPPLKPDWQGRPGSAPTVGDAAAGGAAGAGSGSGATSGGSSAALAAGEPLADRLLDRLNPVLVRELRQSVKSRGFLVALGLVLFAIGLVAVLTAANVKSMREGEAFARALQAMLFATALVIPFRALGSLGREVEGALSEHILMTRLSPGRIVDGHILAACVQLLIVGSLFAPLLALTYLLRGVDIGMVTMGLGFAFTTTLGLTAGAAAAGSLGRNAAVRALGKVLGAIGIVWAAGALAAFLEFSLRFGRFGRVEWAEVLGFWVVPIVLWIALCRLIAKAMLSHPFEDRSSAFRIHALVTSATLFAIVAALKGAGPEADELALAAIGLAIPTWLIAATEEDGLSPLVAATLRGKAAPLVLARAPLFPGGSRGLAFAMLHAGLIVVAARWLPEVFGIRRASETDLGVVALLACYGLFYAAAGRLVRRAFGGGPAKSWTARAVLLGVFAAAMVLPAVVDVIGGGSSWHEGHILNPFYTIDRHDRDPWGMVTAVGALAGVLAILNVRGFAEGLTELVGAVAGRAGRRAEPPVGPVGDGRRESSGRHARRDSGRRGGASGAG